ncbi:MAG: dihydrolipoamide acetyltransferase family protein [Xanthomonadales bacterium]|nr:dihydrolipoamide acetyltransferase family protein [Xanthomonadales bacterium]
MSEYIFKLPDLGEGTVESEIAEWMVKVGDVVKEEDPICSMLTDKAAIELSSPVTGTVKSLAGELGDIVAVGAPLIVFETAGDAAVQKDQAAPVKAEPAATQAAAPATLTVAAAPEAQQSLARNEKVRTSPSIRRMAREAAVDLSQVSGSGPRGRVLKQDFEAFQSGESATQNLAAAAAPASSDGLRRAAGTTEIKVIGLRRKIAERMELANREIPQISYVEEVDITALESLRTFLNNKAGAKDEKLTPLAFIGMALARALAEFPKCNAHYNSERNVIIRHNPIHIGIATQTPDGLKVPVVRHAEARNLQDMAAEIRRVSNAARDNTAKREELSGSTITITSLGRMGGIVTTPIINLPEVAIIGINKAVDRPMVENGQVVVRKMMNLSSSFDHRFVDGYDAAETIQCLKNYLEQPATIFITG